MDFAIGLVNSMLNLPEGQINIFRRVKITEVLQDKYFKFLINSFRPKVAPTKWNLLKQDEVSHYMSDETYWDPVHKIKADIEENFEGKCCCYNYYNYEVSRDGQDSCVVLFIT